MSLKLSFVILVALTSVSVSASMFTSGKHCVGYKFKKKNLSIFNSQVVAKNCDVSAQLLPVVGGGYQIEVSVPISAFESDDRDWDQDLRDALKGSEQPDVIFRSKVMSEKEWKAALQKPKLDLDGEISAANKTFAVVAPCTFTKVPGGIEVDGSTTVPFAKFEIEPPKKVGGLLAKADSNIEIHFHLMSDKFLGADRIFAPVEKEVIKEVIEPVKEKESDKEKRDQD